jgi:hypothetical protein
MLDGAYILKNLSYQNDEKNIKRKNRKPETTPL